jgi:hypothetical protein
MKQRVCAYIKSTNNDRPEDKQPESGNAGNDIFEYKKFKRADLQKEGRNRINFVAPIFQQL